MSNIISIFRSLAERSFTISLLLLALSFSGLAAGAIDPTFSAAGVYVHAGEIRTSAVQPDGKIILAGANFTIANGSIKRLIVRLNADGSVDETFTPPLLEGYLSGCASGCVTRVNAIYVLPDGKILIGGSFRTADGVGHQTIARLNANGSVDHSYNLGGGGNVTDGETYGIDVQPDGKAIVAGPNFASAGRSGLVRLEANGTVDLSFNAGPIGGNAARVQPNGKIVASIRAADSTQYIKRFNADGSEDTSFLALVGSGVATGINLLPDGKVFVYGTFAFLNNTARGRVGTLNSDGSLDASFNSGGAGFNNGASIRDASVDPDGKIVLAGGFTSFNAVTKNTVIRLNADGSLDGTFNFVPVNSPLVNDISRLSTGQYLLNGTITRSAVRQTGGASLRINNDASADNTYRVYTGTAPNVVETVQQADGKVLVGGTFHLVGNTFRDYVARFNSDGSFDAAFAPILTFVIQNNGVGYVAALAVQSDGKILVGGGVESGAQHRLIRLNADGTLDPAFVAPVDFPSGIIDIAVLPDGKILASGAIKLTGVTGVRHVVRLNADGSRDTGFDSGDAAGAGQSKIAVQPDGKIVIVGEFTTFGGSPRGRIARLNTDGSLDATFNPLGGADARIFDVAIQTDGKIVIGGYFNNVNGTARKWLARLNANGSLDGGFNVSAFEGPAFPRFGTVRAVTIQPSGRILIGGEFLSIEGQSRNNIARLNSDGTLDGSFNAGTGADGPINVIKLQSDGRILAGGDFITFNGAPKLGIVRLLETSVRTQFDFDGDGRADLGVFRPSNGTWYLITSSTGERIQNFGTSGDRVAAADYDGDGKTDLAIYRNGAWWYINSGNGSIGLKNWGAATDIPLPSDIDGDGKADFVYYRASTGEWFRSGSGGVNSTIQFGTAGDQPVIADMDGDGKADPTIYRPSTGTYWYKSSVTNADTSVQWGQNGDVPVAADFDGDGKTDAAVWRPSNGAWYVLSSSNGSYTITTWGISGDKPVAADYDGDGRADVAIYRPSTGVWYIMQSTSGFTGMQYGVATDIAVENAFIN